MPIGRLAIPGISSLRGKVLLIAFWSTEIGDWTPETIKLYKAFHDNGLEIIGVPFDQNKTKVQSAAKSAGMTWPEYFDSKRSLDDMDSSYGVGALPAFWLIDKKGMVIDTAVCQARSWRSVWKHCWRNSQRATSRPALRPFVLRRILS